jgi:hypothetical protein
MYFQRQKALFILNNGSKKDNLVSNCYFGIRKYTGILYSKKPV